MKSRLGSLFNSEILSDIKKDLNLKNDLSVPKLLKVVVSVGCGKYIKIIENKLGKFAMMKTSSNQSIIKKNQSKTKSKKTSTFI